MHWSKTHWTPPQYQGVTQGNSGPHFQSSGQFGWSGERCWTICWGRKNCRLRLCWLRNGGSEGVGGSHYHTRSWDYSTVILTCCRPDTGGRRGITQGVSFEFFESFLLIYSHNTLWANFEFFKNCSPLWSKLTNRATLSKNPKVLSWICLKFAHNVPTGFFSIYSKKTLNLVQFFNKLSKNPLSKWLGTLWANFKEIHERTLGFFERITHWARWRAFFDQFLKLPYG